jgi:hypothetical protein
VRLLPLCVTVSDELPVLVIAGCPAGWVTVTVCIVVHEYVPAHGVPPPEPLELHARIAATDVVRTAEKNNALRIIWASLEETA